MWTNMAGNVLLRKVNLPISFTASRGIVGESMEVILNSFYCIMMEGLREHRADGCSVRCLVLSSIVRVFIFLYSTVLPKA